MTILVAMTPYLSPSRHHLRMEDLMARSVGHPYRHPARLAQDIEPSDEGGATKQLRTALSCRRMNR